MADLTCSLNPFAGKVRPLRPQGGHREVAEQSVQAEESELADDRMAALMTVTQMNNQGAEWPVRSAGVMKYVSGLDEEPSCTFCG